MREKRIKCLQEILDKLTAYVQMSDEELKEDDALYTFLREAYLKGFHDGVMDMALE